MTFGMLAIVVLVSAITSLAVSLIIGMACDMMAWMWKNF